MKIIKNPIYVTLLFIALIVYCLGFFGANLPTIISSYLNDFLCMPIVLATCLAIVRILKKNEHIYISLTTISIITIYFIFHFEWFLPKFYERYTADIIDVILYVFGAMIFYASQKKLF